MKQPPRRFPLRRLAAVLVPLAAATAFSAPVADDGLMPRAQAIFKPLPADMAGEKGKGETGEKGPLDPARVELGRLLFFEPRVSLDGTVSCARCHLPGLYGTDGLAKAVGVKGRNNPRNAPTILNAALEFAAHWRGDRQDVEEQAKLALLGPPSFGQPDYGRAMAALEAIPGYRTLFAKAFPASKEPVTPDNWAAAIGAYERTLVTPSPFDAYLKGDAGALSEKAKRGLATFIATGCVACHNGVGVGGGMFAKFGVVEDYWPATGSADIDNGRSDVTKQAADKYVFKVPSLRNVAMTPPYFHDGSVATLPEAVRVMARVQLGRRLDDGEVADIVAFLDSLTGPLPEQFRNAPVLPAAAFRPGN